MHAQVKEDNLQATKQFNADLMQVQDEIKNIILKIYQDHNKSIEVVAEQLHLGGHAIKQQHGPGINNAYIFCSAHAENECKFIYISLKLLLTSLLGDNDPSKDYIREIVNKAKKLGRYRELSDEDQQVLIDELQQAWNERDTGAVQKPMLQLHDVQTMFDHISQEVWSILFSCPVYSH